MKSNYYALLVLLGTGISIFAGMSDWISANVALTSIKKSLRATIGDITWIQSALTIGMAAFTLVAGKLSDIFGSKKVFIYGNVIFFLATILAGASTVPIILIISRFFQGMGIAIIYPSSLHILVKVFSEKNKTKAIGYWAMIALMGQAIACITAGIILHYLSWRWVFLIYLPFIALGIIFIWSIYRENNEQQSTFRSLDFGGIICLIITSCALLIAIIEGNEKWGYTSPFTLFFFALSIIAFIIFIMIEKKHPKPFIDLQVFKNFRFIAGCMINFFLAGNLWYFLFSFSQYAQEILNYSPFLCGLLFLGLAIPFAGLSPISSYFYTKFGLRNVLYFATFINLLGILLEFLFTGHTSLVLLIIVSILIGCGAGLFFTGMSSATISLLPHDQAGMASGSMLLFRYIGISLLIAISAGVANSMKSYLFIKRLALTPVHLSLEQIQHMNNPLNPDPQTQQILSQFSISDQNLIKEIFIHSYLNGYQTSLIIMAISVFLSLGLIYFLKPKIS